MSNGAPVKVKGTNSFIVECDEPLEQYTPTVKYRPYAYKSRSSAAEVERGEERFIRYVVVRNIKTGEEYKQEYGEKECEIDIYWEKPGATSAA